LIDVVSPLLHPACPSGNLFILLFISICYTSTVLRSLFFRISFSFFPEKLIRKFGKMNVAVSVVALATGGVPVIFLFFWCYLNDKRKGLLWEQWRKSVARSDRAEQESDMNF